MVTPEIYDSQLKLTILGDDQASDTINTLDAAVAALINDIESINDIGDVFQNVTDSANSFADAVDSINTALDTLKTNLSAEFSNPFSTLASNAQSAATEVESVSTALNGVKTALSSMGTTNPYSSLENNSTVASTDIGNVSTALATLKSDISGFGSTNPYTSLDTNSNTAATDIGNVSNALSTLKSDVTSFKPPDPFTNLDSDAITLTQDIDGVYKAFNTLTKDVDSWKPKNVFQGIDSDTNTFAGDIKSATSDWSALSKDLSKSITTSNPFNELDGYITTVVSKLENAISLIDEISGKHETVNIGGFTGGSTTFESGSGGYTPAPTATIEDMNSMWESLDSRLGDLDTHIQGLTKELGGSGSNTKGGSTGLKLPISGSDIMTAGMNTMMGYYMLQSLASGAENFQNIQQFMQLGMGQSKGNYSRGSVNAAAQNYLMMSSMGLQTSDLSQIAGNLTQMFATVGTNQSPEIAKLQQLGFTRAQASTSPWEMIQSIQSDYAHLMNRGNSAGAAELLQMTGTSQLANAFSNWSSLRSATSGVNLGMNGSQLSSASKNDTTLEANMGKLSLAFDQLAQSLTPVLNKLVSSFTDLANVFSGKVSITQGFADIAKHLGPMGTAILSSTAALKALKLYIDTNFPGSKSKVAQGAGEVLTAASLATIIEPILAKWITSWVDGQKSAWVGAWVNALPTKINHDISQWFQNNVQTPLEDNLHAFGYSIKGAFETIFASVESAIHNLPLGSLAISQSTVNSTTQKAEQDAFMANWLSNSMVQTLPQGQSGKVSVDHSGNINVTFKNASGISTADQNALRQLASQIAQQIYGQFKLNFNADISF